MVVLHLDTERGWRGGEQQMCYLAAGLERLGHVSHVVCRPRSECADRAMEFGLTVHPLNIRGDLDLLAARRLGALVNELGADIVHAHTSRTHLAAVGAKRHARRPLRAVVHRRVDFSIHKLRLGLSGLKYRRGVDRYIAVTSAVKDVMVADGISAHRIEVIHSGTDLSRFANRSVRPGLTSELGIPGGARVVGTVGFMVDHKDHANLLRAAAQVLRRFPDAFFVIIGEGELRARTEGLAASLGIRDRVSMPGLRADVPDCLRTFEVFCLSSWGEGIGGAVLEAMASRLPVVSTSAGGLNEVVKDGVNGRLVPVRDSAALAEGICRMLADRDEAKRLADAGHETVRREFSVGRMVEKTLRLYENLIGDRMSVQP